MYDREIENLMWLFLVSLASHKNLFHLIAPAGLEEFDGE